MIANTNVAIFRRSRQVMYSIASPPFFKEGKKTSFLEKKKQPPFVKRQMLSERPSRNAAHIISHRGGSVNEN